GSPPRAWGRPKRAFAPKPDTRFTPTCVGTTRERAYTEWGRPVHPHVRGDDVLLAFEPTRAAGSPPRAWGRQVDTVTTYPRVRFTPTCVGTTRTRSRCRCSASVHPHVRGDDMSRMSA